MIVLPSGLATHYAQPVTRLAILWRVERRDGEVFGFTNHDKPITYQGLLYEASAGMDASQINASSALNVDNLELSGFFDSDAITQADMEAGLWDGAALRVLSVCWDNLSLGHETVFVGEMGQFSARSSLYVAEARGMADRLQRTAVRQFLPGCTAELGDARCQVDIEALRVSGTVTAVASRMQFTTSVTSGDYRFGVLTWTGGANDGRSMEVKAHDDGTGEITLQLPMVSAVAAGDTFTVVPGCLKTREACIAYSNIVNFRGYPDVPGQDQMLRPGGV